MVFPAPVNTLILLGQPEITGGVLSILLTVTRQVVVLRKASFTVTVIVVVPTPEIGVPATGLWVMVKLPAGVQLSDATTRPTTVGIEPLQPEELNITF